MPIRFERAYAETIEVEFEELCKRQPDADSPVLVNWQLANGSQMPIRFEGVQNNKSLNRKPANGSQMLIRTVS